MYTLLEYKEASGKSRKLSKHRSLLSIFFSVHIKLAGSTAVPKTWSAERRVLKKGKENKN